LGRCDGLPEAGHAQTDTGRSLTGGVGITGTGAAVSQDARVGDEMVRGGVGDLSGDDVAGTHPLITGSRTSLETGRAGREMDQPAIPRPTGHPGRARVLAPFTRGNQQFNGLADQSPVVLE
jgi:hypothetical protein